jgi:hypothetical protein
MQCQASVVSLRPSPHRKDAVGSNRTFRHCAANGGSEPTLPIFCAAAKVRFRGTKKLLAENTALSKPSYQPKHKSGLSPNTTFAHRCSAEATCQRKGWLRTRAGAALYPDKPATAAVHARRSTNPRSWSAGTGTQRPCFATRWLCKVVTTFSGFWYLGQPQAFFCYFGIDLFHGGVIIRVLKQSIEG